MENHTEQQPVSPEMAAMMNDPRMVERAKKMVTRYVYSPLFDCLVTGSLPSGQIPKGFIYPVPIIVRENTHAGQVELNREDNTQRYEEIFPQEIVGVVLGAYGNRGAVEIASLAGMPENTFYDLKINDLFFGEPQYDLNRQAIIPNVDQVRSNIDAVLQRFAKSSANVRRVIEGAAREVLSSLKVAELFARGVLDESHANIDAARNGDNTKNATYDARDHRCFAFLNRQPETAAWRVKAEAPQVQQPVPAQVFDWAEFRQEMAQTVAGAVATAVGETVKQLRQVQPVQVGDYHDNAGNLVAAKGKTRVKNLAKAA